VLFAALVLLSLPPRIGNIGAPLTGPHEFRQTQTAMSVWEMREHGVSLVHPKLPLFGPPWECPFEYPIFQMCAAGVDAIAPWHNLDLSIRLTSIVFYYLAAVVIFALARELFPFGGIPLFAAAIFLFSPYHIIWSRTSMIEYAAVFFGFAHLYVCLKYLREGTRILVVAGLALGTLACLTKITSFIIPCMIAGAAAAIYVFENYFTGAGFQKNAPRRPSPAKERTTLWRAAIVGCMIIAPIVIGYAYAKFGDRIKEASYFTSWLSSRDPYSRQWNYGTSAQRLSLLKWEIILDRMQGVIAPYLGFLLVVGVVVVPFRIRKLSREAWLNRLFGFVVALSPIAIVLLFFNLYWIHTYYLIACSPILALAAAVGVATLLGWIRTQFLKVVAGLVLIGIWLHTTGPIIADMFRAPRPDPRIAFLQAAGAVIPKNDPVIVVSGQEWSAFAPYYLKHRAFMAMLVNKPVTVDPLLDSGYFKTNGFHWLVMEGETPGVRETAQRIASHWTTVTKVTLPEAGVPYELYKLANAVSTGAR
jgi:hypothetical protein